MAKTPWRQRTFAPPRRVPVRTVLGLTLAAAAVAMVLTSSQHAAENRRGAATVYLSGESSPAYPPPDRTRRHLSVSQLTRAKEDLLPHTLTATMLTSRT